LTNSRTVSEVAAVGDEWLYECAWLFYFRPRRTEVRSRRSQLAASL